MSEYEIVKRFELTKSCRDDYKIFDDYRIYDHEKEDAYFLSTNSKGTIKDIVELLNSLNDDYHTMQELYDFRLVLNALLFNNWYMNNTYEVYKSKRHYDGEICFEDDPNDWFIVVAILPSGQVTNHYLMDYWDYFQIPDYPKVKHEFDNHTSKDVLKRYKEVL